MSKRLEGLQRCAVVQQYDANGNGQIDADELSNSPAFNDAPDRLDTNSDGAISAAEITAGQASRETVCSALQELWIIFQAQRLDFTESRLPAQSSIFLKNTIRKRPWAEKLPTTPQRNVGGAPWS
ncbi:MAG: hypothetical protein MK171_07530 [Pirellulales bacterium]|nr:hypothetical protein [Pirellulales bacterium]